MVAFTSLTQCVMFFEIEIFPVFFQYVKKECNMNSGSALFRKVSGRYKALSVMNMELRSKNNAPYCQYFT